MPSTKNRQPQPTKTLRITITINGKNKIIVLDPSKLPLVFLEALEELREDQSWRHMRRGIQKLLKLTDDEADELDTSHFMQIVEAVTGAADIPNAIEPLSG